VRAPVALAPSLRLALISHDPGLAGEEPIDRVILRNGPDDFTQGPLAATFQTLPQSAHE
jgi:hypothetical protein